MKKIHIVIGFFGNNKCLCIRTNLEWNVEQ